MTIKLGTSEIVKRYQGTTEIKKVYSGSTLIYDKSAPPIPTDGLISEWLLNGNANDTLSANNGTSTNITYTTGLKGKQCAVFNGSNGYIDCGSSGTLNTLNLSISFWFKSSTSSEQYIITNSGFNSNDRWYMGLGQSSNKFNAYLAGKTSAGWHISNASVCDGNWHCIIVTCDASQIEIFIDGTLDKTITTGGSLSTSAQTTLIGTRDGPYPYLNGNIQNIRYYNRALNSTEKTQISNELL